MAYSFFASDHFCYAFLISAHISLVWILPYFPTQDGPSHLYNLIILDDLIKGGGDWGNFFEYQINLLPNWGFNLFSYPLIQFFSPINTEKIFISIYILLMGLSLITFLHVFNRPIYPYSYIGLLVIYNFTLMMGNYSYTIGIPLFFFALSLHWNGLSRTKLYQFITLNISGYILFLCHLIPFGLFLLSSMIFAIVGPIPLRRKLRNLLEHFIYISPCFIILLIYLWQNNEAFYDTSSLNSNFSFSKFYLFSLSRLLKLWAELLSYSTANFSPWQIVPTSMLGFLFLISLNNSVKMNWKKWRLGQEIPSWEKSIALISLITVLIYFLAPFRLGESSFINQRFPWVIYLILIPLLRIPDKAFLKKYGKILIIAIVLLSLALNSILLWQQSIKIENCLKGLQADLPKGAYLVTYKKLSAEWSRVDVLLHVASYYGIAKKIVDIGNYEARTPFFPIYFRMDLASLPNLYQIEVLPESIDWNLYPTIQYLLGIKINREDRIKLAGLFYIILENEETTVWGRLGHP